MSLGFSLYFGLDNSFEENINLLYEAKRFGFTRIFTSFHIPEINYDLLKLEVRKIFEVAKKFDMEIITDISPNTFKFLGIENSNLKSLMDFGVKTIRIDFGYSPEEIAKMSNNPYGLKVQLNGSTITREILGILDKCGINYENVDALHNFYPRIGTGISEDLMIQKNNLLNSFGIKVGAFVQSNNRKRSPLRDGLPTLEDHRNKNVRQSANHLFALGNSSVFIGDSLPSHDELQDLSELKQDAIELRIKLYSTDVITHEILNNIHTSRIDEARDVIRSSESRLLLGENKIIPMNTVDKFVGDITIDNFGYGRYMGELQILKINQIGDKRTNVVAKILQEDIYLLKYIKQGKRFYFSIVS